MWEKLGGWVGLDGQLSNSGWCSCNWASNRFVSATAPGGRHNRSVIYQQPSFLLLHTAIHISKSLGHHNRTCGDLTPLYVIPTFKYDLRKLANGPMLVMLQSLICCSNYHLYCTSGRSIKYCILFYSKIRCAKYANFCFRIFSLPVSASHHWAENAANKTTSALAGKQEYWLIF